MAILHQTSPVQLRMNINDAQLAISSRDPEILADRVSIALQRGAKDEAAKYAGLAYQSGKNRILAKLSDIYRHENALASMPDDLCSGNETSKLRCAAHIELAKGNEQAAEQKYLEAALSSPWPIQAYAELAQQYIDQKKWPQAEQTIAQMMEKFPHAYTPFVYRAIYGIAQNHAEDAWQDYLTARSLSLDTKNWIAHLIRACAVAQNVDFAQKMYQREIDLGTIDEDIWTDTLFDVFLDAQNAQNFKVSSKEWAQIGLQFIEHVMPRSAYLGSELNRMRISQLTYMSTH